MYYVSTPIGTLLLSVDNEGKPLRIELASQTPYKQAAEENPPEKQLAQQLIEYFAGTRKNFEIPIDFSVLSGTPFQKSVWLHLSHIPYGQIVTYKQLAEKINKPKATRAVGNALNKNPLLIILPCHRVIGSNGSLTGFAAGIENKQFLLDLEHSHTAD